MPNESWYGFWQNDFITACKWERWYVFKYPKSHDHSHRNKNCFLICSTPWFVSWRELVISFPTMTTQGPFGQHSSTLRLQPPAFLRDTGFCRPGAWRIGGTGISNEPAKSSSNLCNFSRPFLQKQDHDVQNSMQESLPFSRKWRGGKVEVKSKFVSHFPRGIIPWQNQSYRGSLPRPFMYGKAVSTILFMPSSVFSRASKKG